ncbi:hypothetical protein CLOSTASPAR_00131 [[Clostridium] asparagiforme DSM 15981]|uniref:Uncharacterized protein n=1 Tax=[Clostridium] asparagiforme DSM 15981 TaxID=518636 RepID=C0CT35_9FIRM|nr:hypothetical protein CLOSTASPAR_00131 [[Clostridium] asparagiforme DSM 15981]
MKMGIESGLKAGTFFALYDCMKAKRPAFCWMQGGVRAAGGHSPVE